MDWNTLWAALSAVGAMSAAILVWRGLCPALSINANRHAQNGEFDRIFVRIKGDKPWTLIRLEVDRGTAIHLSTECTVDPSGRLSPVIDPVGQRSLVPHGTLSFFTGEEAQFECFVKKESRILRISAISCQSSRIFTRNAWTAIK